jgi:IS30 family transposase
VGRLHLPRAVRVAFWDGIRAGLLIDEAARLAGISHPTALRWFGECGGVTSNAPRAASVPGRYLSLAEREEIALRLAAGESKPQIAAALGRPPCTVYREVARNSGYRGRYRAMTAQENTDRRARRPKVSKLAVDGPLRNVVQQRLTARWSPEQIAATLKVEYPSRPEMRVSHETIYQSLYVQGRGALRRELATCLRTGRALRRPRRRTGERRGRIPGMVNISERPAEAADRAYPGHWEGDLIIGSAGKSAIGTLVERTSRFCLLLHLPEGHNADQVRDRMIEIIRALPGQLRRSLTWDQGAEMARHLDITAATDLDIYFCDPHSPWQRGTNENTNGLLRQYFPKGSDLSVYPAEILAAVAAELNARPRKTLDWRTPAQVLTEILSRPDDTAVATTG